MRIARALPSCPVRGRDHCARHRRSARGPGVAVGGVQPHGRHAPGIDLRPARDGVRDARRRLRAARLPAQHDADVAHPGAQGRGARRRRCSHSAYVLLAGAEVPAVRTLLMLVVGAIGLWLARPGTALLVWLWSLAGVLAWDPWAGFAPGFWLSFGAVGLAAVCRQRTPRSRACRAGRLARFADTLHEAGRAQWVVTLGLVPGTLALFQQVSVVSALANAVAIPVVTLAVVPLILFAIAFPIDAPWQFAHGVLALLMRYLEWVAELPVATWTSHAPVAWTVGRRNRRRAVDACPSRHSGTLPRRRLDVAAGAAAAAAGARWRCAGHRAGRWAGSGGLRRNGDACARLRHGSAVQRYGRCGRPHCRAIPARGRRRETRYARSSATRTPIIPAVPRRCFARCRLQRCFLRCRRIIRSWRRRSARQPSRAASADTTWQWDRVTFTLLHPRAEHYGDATRKSNDLSCVLRIEAGRRPRAVHRRHRGAQRKRPAAARATGSCVGRARRSRITARARRPRHRSSPACHRVVAVVRRRLSQPLRPSARRRPRALSASRCSAAAHRFAGRDHR